VSATAAFPGGGPLPGRLARPGNRAVIRVDDSSGLRPARSATWKGSGRRRGARRREPAWPVRQRRRGHHSCDGAGV